MRTINTNIYEYNELSDEAKARAYKRWLEVTEYPFYDDLLNSLKEFENLFDGNIRITDLDFDYKRIKFRSSYHYDIEMLSGVRLLKYLWNNFGDKLYEGKYYSCYTANTDYRWRKSNIILVSECPLTGCYTDCLVLDKLIEYMHKPNELISFVHLIQICLNNFIREACKSIEEWFCEDVFHDECELNSWEFYEDGTRV